MIFYLHNINMPAKKIYLFLNHIIKKTSICTSLFLCTIIFLQACVSTTKLHFVKTSKVKSVYISGQEFFISKKNQSQVIASFPESRLKTHDKLYLYFNLKNLSQKPFTFKPKKHIQIIKKSDNSRIAIKSYRDLIRELDDESNKTKGAWLAGSLAVVATALIFAKANSKNSNKLDESENTEGYSSYSTEITHSDKTKTIYKHKSYNSSLAHMERRSKKNQQTLEHIGQSIESQKHQDQQRKIYDQQIRRLKKTILKKHTVMPQKEMHGQVALSLSKLELPVESFIVLVKFAGDRHKFYFKQTKD